MIPGYKQFYCDSCQKPTFHEAGFGKDEWNCEVCGHRLDNFRERVRQVRRNVAVNKARAARLLSQKRDREYALFELGKL